MAREVDCSPSFVGSGPREQLPAVASLKQVLRSLEITEDKGRVERVPLPGVLDHRLLSTLSFSLQHPGLERAREDDERRQHAAANRGAAQPQPTAAHPNRGQRVIDEMCGGGCCGGEQIRKTVSLFFTHNEFAMRACENDNPPCA